MTDLTRPIIGIENRTPLEVFDIMCDRIRHRLASTPAAPANTGRAEVLEEAARECERLADEGDERQRSFARTRSWMNCEGDGQRKAAAAIRALKSTPTDATAVEAEREAES